MKLVRFLDVILIIDLAAVKIMLKCRNWIVCQYYAALITVKLWELNVLIRKCENNTCRPVTFSARKDTEERICSDCGYVSLYYKGRDYTEVEASE